MDERQAIRNGRSLDMTAGRETDCRMIIEAWWPQLRPATRQWLIANNGEAVPPLIVDEIAAVGGPAATDA